jgi:hypothetical protein
VPSRRPGEQLPQRDSDIAWASQVDVDVDGVVVLHRFVVPGNNLRTTPTTAGTCPAPALGPGRW